MGIVDEEEKVLNSDEEATDTQVLTDGFVDAVIDPFDQLVPSNPVEELVLPVQLTEEQKEQVRKNKERAETLRQERLKRIQEKSSQFLESSNASISQTSQTSTQENTDLIQGQEFSSTQGNESLGLSESQMEQIKINKENAERRRQEKLKQNKESCESLEPHSPLHGDQASVGHYDSQKSMLNEDHEVLENHTLNIAKETSVADDSEEVDVDKLLGVINEDTDQR